MLKQWQFSLIKPREPFEVYVTKGKFKGKVGLALRESYGTSLRVCFDGRPTPDYSDHALHYKMVEFTDGRGNPAPEPVRDMSGRPIEIDAWVVYSVKSGNSSHGLEIGKVIRIGETGSLTVKRIMKNGDAIADKQYSRDTRVVNDAWRSLRLPVDSVLLTTWVLKDFQDLKTGDLLD